MADASHPFDARRRRPRDWGDAFANLPLDTPPLSVWSQISARLDAAAADAAHGTPTAPTPHTAPRRARRAFSARTWLALAASLSALALLPALWPGAGDGSGAATSGLAQRAPDTATRRTALGVADASAPTTAPRLPGVSAERAATAPGIATAPLRPSAVAAEAAIAPTALAPMQALAVAAPVPEALPPPMAPVADVPAPSVAAPTPARIASVDPDALPANAVLIGDTHADATSREMEMLYAASAQLETLLAYAREPRVETGPAAALSSQIHSRLAKIDARLALPDLSANEQHALWQARVGTLRQAVAFESELRALAAEGQGYEGELVEVY